MVGTRCAMSQAESGSAAGNSLCRGRRPTAQPIRILWAGMRDRGPYGPVVGHSARPARSLEMEVLMMRRRNTTSRAKQRQELLRELAADEAVYVISGEGHSRAVEALEALRRIEDGTYGICVDCGVTIPPARLQVKPEATRCIACQTECEHWLVGRRGDSNYVARRSA